MNIFIVCSKSCYDKVPAIRETLEAMGHRITLPNSFDDPTREEQYLAKGKSAHAEWKAGMLKLSLETIMRQDALLVLNFEKKGIPNYIGGATFLEMYDAFQHGKPLFLYNDIPEGMLADEIAAFQPIVINGDLRLLRL